MMSSSEVKVLIFSCLLIAQAFALPTTYYFEDDYFLNKTEKTIQVFHDEETHVFSTHLNVSELNIPIPDNVSPSLNSSAHQMQNQSTERIQRRLNHVCKAFTSKFNFEKSILIHKIYCYI